MDKGARSSHTNDDEDVPFMPKLSTFLICQEKLKVTWFEPDFCQSRYSFDKNMNGSNSCTIIVLLIASYCNCYNIPMDDPSQDMSSSFVKTIGKAILDGNYIHKLSKRKGLLNEEYLTIPEAINCAEKRVKGIKEWKSFVYMKPILDTLDVNLTSHLNEWKSSSRSKRYSDLYVVLICDSRSVLFIFNNNSDTITLVDTHQHSTTKGAVVAVVQQKYKKCLCTYLCYMNSKYYNSYPSLYELSFIYFRRRQ